MQDIKYRIRKEPGEGFWIEELKRIFFIKTWVLVLDSDYEPISFSTLEEAKAHIEKITTETKPTYYYMD